MNKTKAYLDTTIFTDALVKPGEKAERAKAAIKHFATTELPVYAIKEFKAGPLYGYVWLYNKLLLTKSYEKTLNLINRMALGPRKYLTATAIEALTAAAHRTGNLTDEQLTKMQRRGGRDRELAEIYRLSLKNIIIKSWKRRRSLTTTVSLPLSCYVETEPYENHQGIMSVEPYRCDADPECCLAQSLRSSPQSLVKLLRAINQEPSKRENDRRGQVLKNLLKKPSKTLEDKDCRALGDAIFAFFCPADAVILTTNTKDHRPLARALGKDAVAPEDLV